MRISLHFIMRHILLILLLGITTIHIQAQSQRNNPVITGHLTDIDSKEPLDQATIQLFWISDSSFVGGTISNEKGNFAVEAPSNGTFRLKITSVGYQSLVREVSVRNLKDVDMGDLRLTPDAVMLEGTVVTANVPQVVVKKDTLVYNPEAYRTPEGSAIEELIKRMPGSEIDEDGNITINGKQVKKIMLDGKEFMLGDIESALKNLPVSIIQNVKFYDRQSDQSRITGIEDGNKETVLDFTVKKGMNRGYMTNMDIAGGTKNRYSGRVTGSSFTDNTRLVIMGNANNKEENAGWWNRRGLNSQKMLGGNINYDDGKKLKIDGSIRWNHRDGDNQNENSSENFYSQSHRTFSNSKSANFTRSNNWNGNMRLEWKPDTLTNIMMRASGSLGTNDGTNASTSATFSQNPYLHVQNPLDIEDINKMNVLGFAVNHNQQTSMSYGENKSANASVQLYRRLNPRGR
ncbi:MAG: carboxypeptidase-like regulatory domain-containing protein, partial [Prevotella sp.]|nr:carboxypeptidase-like regulatory domain-containing protein [Prevotella sp.]